MDVLIGRSAWRDGVADLRTTLVLGSSARAHLAQRNGLRFDSRFTVGAHEARGVATLYLVLDGWIATDGQGAVRGPCAWVMGEDEFDRVTPGSPSFRSWGEPLTALDLCLPVRDVLAEAGVSYGPRPVSAEVWAAARALATSEDDVAIARALRETLEALYRCEVITRAPIDALADAESPQTERLWKVMAAFYRDQSTSAIVKALAQTSGVSLRQTERDLAEICRRFGFFGSFRDTARVLRLRRAVVLLSAEHSSVARVAGLVGYGSADAMGRAFRDAGLPPPGAVRDALRDDTNYRQ